MICIYNKHLCNSMDPMFPYSRKLGILQIFFYFKKNVRSLAYNTFASHLSKPYLSKLTISYPFFKVAFLTLFSYYNLGVRQPKTLINLPILTYDATSLPSKSTLHRIHAIKYTSSFRSESNTECSDIVINLQGAPFAVGVFRGVHKRA